MTAADVLRERAQSKEVSAELIGRCTIGESPTMASLREEAAELCALADLVGACGALCDYQTSGAPEFLEWHTYFDRVEEALARWHIDQHKGAA